VLSSEAFATVVREGSLESRGMPRFPELSDRELDGLRHYIRSQAEQSTVK
jgi:quinohemoprotein ethanol dehydrogenase